MLESGSKGAQVGALQKALMAGGISPGSIDGVFGPKTEAAVKRCQERCGVNSIVKRRPTGRRFTLIQSEGRPVAASSLRR